MRAFIVIFIVALCMCTLLSSNAGMPAMMKFGVSDIKTGTSSTKMSGDGLVGELKIVDGYRPYFRPDKVSEKDSGDRIDFPQMGRFH